MRFCGGWFVASPVGAPFMTPGAGTAQLTSRVGYRRMRAGRWLVCGVARGGAIYDARCRNGTCGRSRCVSADAGGASVDCCFAVVVLWFFRRPVCGIASVIRASQVAPLRLWRLNVVSRWLVCGVARGGAIHDARCRNGTCGRSRCVSVDAGGAVVGLSFCVGRFAAPRRLSGRHGWRPYVCGWLNVVLWRSSGRHGWRPYVCGRLNAVSRRSSGRHKWRPYVCGWLNVVSRRLSGRHKWRPYVCGWLIAVSRVVVGGVTGAVGGRGWV